MKIAILGGGGCFALNFARHLSSLGVECFGIGRSGPKQAPFWLAPERYRFHQLHLVNRLDQRLALGLLDDLKPDVIVNFAAQGEGAASFSDHAPDYFQTNCVALVQLVCELRKRDYLQRFVHISTSELYGSTQTPANEAAPLHPTSPYAISKAAFDLYLESMHRTFGFPINIVRPSNCYTPGQQLHRIIPKAFVSAFSERKLPLEGGGVARKSYLHATDLSTAIMAILLQGKIGKTYNVGPVGKVSRDGDDCFVPRQPIAIVDLVRLIAERASISFSDLVDIVPDRIGQDSCYWIDATELARDTGWQQQITIEQGLDDMRKWILHFPELVSMSREYEHRP